MTDHHEESSPEAPGRPERLILDILPQCVFLKDSRLRFRTANHAFCASVGRAERDLLGEDDFTLYPPALAEGYRAIEQRVLNDGAAAEGLEDRPLAGSLRTTQTLRTPVSGPDGSVTGVLGVLWDVTDQRRLEVQLRQGQKREAVVQLAGGIAHDFNNLLTGILNNLALIRAGLSGGPPEVSPLHEHLDSAERIGRRAAELVHQLLGFARRMQMCPEPVDLNQTVGEALRTLRPSLGLGVSVEAARAPDLWPVHADRDQIARVLRNLCGNARDAMPRGGRLRLETANVTLDREAAGLHLDGRPGEFVCLTVSDTGTGIPAEVLPRLFDPFFTTKDLGQGPGLGLAMALGIVKEHRGWITSRSRLGQGSAFEIYLPRGSTRPAPAGTARRAEAVTTQGPVVGAATA